MSPRRAAACALALVLSAAPRGVAAPRRARAPGPEPAEPPLNISADNVTGSHGPEGDIVLLNGNVRITRGRTRAHLRTTAATCARPGCSTSTATSAWSTAPRRSPATTPSYSESDDILKLERQRRGRSTATRCCARRAASYDRAHRHAPSSTAASRRATSTSAWPPTRVTYDPRLARWCRRAATCAGRRREQARARTPERSTTTAPRTRRSRRGSPCCARATRTSASTVMRARTLRLNTETRVAEAIDSVTRGARHAARRAPTTGCSTTGSSAAGCSASPRAWDDETTVTGDTLELWTEKRVLERVVVRGNAVMDYRGRGPTRWARRAGSPASGSTCSSPTTTIDSLVAVGEARNEYQAVPRPPARRRRRTSPRATRSPCTSRTARSTGRVVEGGARGEYRFAVDRRATPTAAEREVVRYDAHAHRVPGARRTASCSTRART